MRTIIAGSRGFSDYTRLEKELLPFADTITTVLSGMAGGVDQLGVRWALEHNKTIERYPADWERFGKAAGPLRNLRMAEKAEMLIAFWDKQSRGTQHMIETAIKKELEVIVIYTNA